jgi:ketosteroid isomerase-like protein
VSSEVEALVDTGDRIVALIHGSFTLVEGSQPLESDYAHIWTIRNGKASRVEAVDRAEALRLVRESS